MTPDEARARLASLPAAASAALDDTMGEVAEAVAQAARRQLATAAPSQPGAPPADPSGHLAAAIAVVRTPAGDVTVKVDTPYAADLEYGTRRMAARPFLRPAVAATAEPARRKVAEALSRAVALAFGAGP